MNATGLEFVNTVFATTSKVPSSVYATMASPSLPTITPVLTWTSVNDLLPFAITAPASTPWAHSNVTASRDSKLVPMESV